MNERFEVLRTFAMFLALLCGKIEGIKYVRSLLGNGIADAKFLVEDMFYSGADLDASKIGAFFGLPHMCSEQLANIIRNLKKASTITIDEDIIRMRDLLKSAEEDCKALRNENAELRDKVRCSADSEAVEELTEMNSNLHAKVEKLREVINLLIE